MCDYDLEKPSLSQLEQGSLCACVQPMRDDVTVVTSSLIGWAHTQNGPNWSSTLRLPVVASQGVGNMDANVFILQLNIKWSSSMFVTFSVFLCCRCFPELGTAVVNAHRCMLRSWREPQRCSHPGGPQCPSVPPHHDQEINLQNMTRPPCPPQPKNQIYDQILRGLYQVLCVVY